MADKPYACRRCGKRYVKRRSLTNLGYCRGCGVEVMLENVAELQAKSGPRYEAWRQAQIRALGGDAYGGRGRVTYHDVSDSSASG